MHKVDAPNHSNNEFTDGDAASGILATILGSKWLNTVQRELIAILSAASVTPDDAQDNQVIGSILSLIPKHTFASGTIMLFGQNSAPTGWTRKTNWQDNAMLCYAAAGNITSGGGVNPQSAHNHTVASHSHTGPSHTHTGPSHSHTIGNDISNYISVSLGSGYSAVGGTVGDRNHNHLASAGGTGNTGAGGTGSTGLSGSGNTGQNTAPHYQEVIAATKD